MSPLLQYTICFIYSGDEMLMLNRNKPANMGLWNGVGGKLDPGETPTAGALREIREETGLNLADVAFSGIVTWDAETQGQSGMYAFLANVEASAKNPRMQETREGVLAWKRIDWILHADNLGVAPHVSRFLARMLDDSTCYEHCCRFVGGQLVHYTVHPLPDTFYNVHQITAPSTRA